MSRIDAAVVARAAEAARALLPLADANERARRLIPEAVQLLIDSGLPKIFVPRAFGGAEASPSTAVAALEALARGDGATGWCGMVAATSGLMAAFVPPAEAARIWGPADALTAGVFAPLGRAERTPTGWRVSGRWSFGSGVQHASWTMGGALTTSSDGTPALRSFLFPTAALTIHDTWDTSGLRGSGSHDFEAQGVEVPDAHAFSLLTDVPRHDGALYRQPFFGALAAGVAAVSLGIARAAVDALIDLARTKHPQGAKRTLAHRELVQHAVARAEGMIGAARAGLLHQLDEAAAEIEQHGAASLVMRARVRLAACHATTESARAVDLAYEAGGGTAIYATSPLQRCFRDVHVTTQHVMVSATSATMAGRVLLGVESDVATL